MFFTLVTCGLHVLTFFLFYCILSICFGMCFFNVGWAVKLNCSVSGTTCKQAVSFNLFSSVLKNERVVRGGCDIICVAVEWKSHEHQYLI